jgi:transcriptional regulator with XRE-family HTH domain
MTEYVTDKWDRRRYSAELAANIRAARSRAGMSQKSLAERMTALGFKWAYQTVGKVENDNRPLLATELLGLALALNVTLPYLMGVSEEDHFVEVSPQLAIGSITARRLAMGVLSEFTRTIEWTDDDKVGASWVYSTPTPAGDARAAHVARLNYQGGDYLASYAVPPLEKGTGE